MIDNQQIKKGVTDYYGSTLKTSSDLQTNAYQQASVPSESATGSPPIAKAPTAGCKFLSDNIS